MRKQQQRALRTYEQTLDAAAEEFLSLGYARATLAGVAARTGMTKGALYGHFPSKQAVAVALVTHTATACTHVLDEAADRGPTALDTLRLTVTGIGGRLAGDARMQAGFRLVVESTSDIANCRPLAQRLACFFQQHTAAAHSSGQITSACNPTTLATLILTLLLNYHRLQSAAGLALSPSDIEAAWRLIEQALSPPPAAL